MQFKKFLNKQHKKLNLIHLQISILQYKVQNYIVIH